MGAIAGEVAHTSEGEVDADLARIAASPAVGYETVRMEICSPVGACCAVGAITGINRQPRRRSIACPAVVRDHVHRRLVEATDRGAPSGLPSPHGSAPADHRAECRLKCRGRLQGHRGLGRRLTQWSGQQRLATGDEPAGDMLILALLIIG